MDGFLVVGGFVLLFVFGFPVVLALAIPCIVYLFAKDLPLDLLAQRTLYSLDSFPLVAVPVFLFVGSLMTSAGISRHIYKFADTAVGRLPGGLAQVNVVTSVFFGFDSGSSTADASLLAKMTVPEMVRSGYPAPFCCAVTIPQMKARFGEPPKRLPSNWLMKPPFCRSPQHPSDSPDPSVSSAPA